MHEVVLTVLLPSRKINMITYFGLLQNSKGKRGIIEKNTPSSLDIYSTPMALAI
jgi:hypothetical protein